MQKYQWISPTESFPWCSTCNEVGLESWTLERVIWKVFIGERVHKEEQEIVMENWLFLFVDSIYTLCSQFSKRWIPLTTQTETHYVSSSNKRIIIQIPNNLPLRSPIHSHLSNSIESIFIPPFSVPKHLFYLPKHEQFDKQQLNTFSCSWPHLPTNRLPPSNMKKHT